ncbi:MAG TPA: hypothetical protein VKH35_14280 [Thermoanaerobaculia bacterium]|nr:hypothetical protein [Thermoanaerobaculia bacterium]
MKQLAAIALSVLMTAPAWAQTAPPPQTAAAPAIPSPTADAKMDQVTADFRTIERVAGMAPNINDARATLLAIVDNDVDTLREPRDNGTYRWASLQREEASRVKDEKSIERVYTEKELREVTLTAPRAYRVEISVPRKRSLFSANNRVFVRNVEADSTGFDDKITHHEIPVNAWVNPGDSTSVALPEIGKSVQAMAELGVESGEKHAVADVALLQAKLVDDPASPYFPAVQRLLKIRDVLTQHDLNRGFLKTTADEALMSVPGELQKRIAEQNAAAERRKSGGAPGAIAQGDATPDVVAALQEISHLLVGTLQDQADGRAQLQKLIDTLQPPPPAKP